MKKFQHVGTLKVKLQKGRYRNKDLTKNSKILLGNSGIQLGSKGNIGIREIISAKKILAKTFKGVAKLWVRFMPERSITKKPSEVRMGKGKGKPYTWVYNVKAGMILFEFSAFIMTKGIRKNVETAMSKLSFPTKFIRRLF